MQIGPYWIEGEIGRGGAGVVFRATAPQGAPVALKILGGQTQAAFARFQREVQLQSELTGEGGFVPVLDAGICPRGPYLVMPFLPGGTLRDRLRAAPDGLALTELVDLGEALASAIGRAHALGLVHRDLKPENVLFDHLDCPQIADLGLAKAMDASDPGSSAGLSKTGELRGTLGYMPLEQIQDAKRASASADVFALGAILYECATGRPAFSGQGALEVMDAIRRGRYTDLRSLRRDLPKSFANLLARCLSSDPSLRPADGGELAEALATVGLGESSQRAGRAPLLVAGLVLGALGLAGAYLATRSSAPEPSVAGGSPALSSTPSPVASPPVTPAPSETPRPASSPSPSQDPAPAASPAPTPAPSPPARERFLGPHAQALSSLESIAIHEQLGIGSYRSTTPPRAIFLVQGGQGVAVWDEDYVWTFSLPDFRPTRSVRIGFASLAERRDPKSVRALNDAGDCLVQSVEEGAFIHVAGNGVRVGLEEPLVAAEVLSAPPLVALASGKAVSLISCKTRELHGTLLHEDPVVAIASTPNSNRLLSATRAGDIHLWELSEEENKHVHVRQIGKLPRVERLILTRGADTWAAVSPALIHLESLSGKRKPLNVELQDDSAAPRSVQISEDESLLLIGSDAQITELEIETRKVKRRVNVPEALVRVVTGNAEYLVFVAKSSPHLIRQLNLRSGESHRAGYGQVGAVTGVGRALEGVVVADDGGGHSYWRRGQPRYVRLTPGPITGLVSHKGKTLLARRGAPSTVVKLEDGTPHGPEDSNTYITRGAQGKVLLGAESGLVRLRQPGQDLAEWRLHQTPVLGARVLPRGVASWARGEPSVVVSREGQVQSRLPIPADEVVDVAPLRGDGGVLAIGVRSGRISVFELRQGRLVTKVAAADQELTCMTSHRSGRLLLVGDRASNVRIYAWQDGTLSLKEEATLGLAQDFPTYAYHGRTLDHLYLGTARGVVLLGRWLPTKRD